MDSELKQSIIKLYLFAFAAGGMFFYGIEQFFLESFADGDFARGVLLAVFSATFALTNLPTGAVSDVWGRVNSLRLAAVTLVVSLVILGLSSSLFVYAIGSILFALFWALWDGAAEAFLYDKMVDYEYEKHFEQYQGKVTASMLLGAALANFSSGFLAEATSLQFTYFTSIIPALVALTVSFMMVEPEHHRQVGSSIKRQLSGVYREIRKSRMLMYFVIAGVFIFVLSLISGEFTQPVIVRFTDSPRVLGITWMGVALLMAAGASISYRLKSQIVIMMLTALSILVYILFSDSLVGVAGLIAVVGLAEAAANKNGADVQRLLPSKLRASAGSLTSTISNMIIPGVALIVGAGASVNIRNYLGGAMLVLATLASIALLLGVAQKVSDNNRSVL